MEWFNEPGKFDVAEGSGPEVEGTGGGWELSGDSKDLLVLRPDTKKDFWKRTYYNPQISKHDAPCLMKSVPSKEEMTMEVYF